MSLSKKKVIKSVAVAIMAVSIFVAAIYYFVPGNPHTGVVAFGWSPFDITTPNNGMAYALVPQVNVEFSNGSTSSFDPGAGGLNSTDIEEIQLAVLIVYASGSNINFTMPYSVAFQYLENVTVQTSLTDNGTVDLGDLQVANFTSSVSIIDTDNGETGNCTIPIQSFPENHTGFWTGNFRDPGDTWQMSIDQIQSMLPSGTSPVNIAFYTDLSLNIGYQLATPNVNKTGNALMEWSGIWGTLQLLHDGTTLLGMQCDFQSIQLDVIAQ